jgi:hypothetical protein
MEGHYGHQPRSARRVRSGGYGCVAGFDTIEVTATPAGTVESVAVTRKYDVVAVVSPVRLKVTTPAFTVVVPTVADDGEVMSALADFCTV